jgi:hypothetical protein
MASMGFNPFTRHTESQPSKPNDQGQSASTPEPQAPAASQRTFHAVNAVASTPEPQTTTAGNAAETEERPPARPVEKKPASAARTSKVINPFAGHEGKKQFRRIRKEGPPPAQKLLDWLRDWPHPVIGLRDIVLYGPSAIQNRNHAIHLAEVLVGHGWLVPIECRRDTKWWRIVRGPSGYPTMTNVAVNVAANVAINVATEGG